MPRPVRSRRPAAPAALLLAALAAALVAPGCESKMDPKECDKLRGEAFELVNKAQHCNTDADCRPSEWPGCQKPLSTTNHQAIAPMKAKYTEGKCEEPKVTCPEAPPIYCKQGLCAAREKGTTEGSSNTPVDQIQIQ